MLEDRNNSVSVSGREQMTIARNPIMPGFYPDPSICAVDGDYYLINSTFSYFPGLPILHSKDLAHWEQAGNAIHKHSQVLLENGEHSQGLFAPVLRYYNGTYYVICTNVTHGGSFIVTAQNPEGPWSEPYYIEGADGIDPSLFFDEDGTCYYIGTHPNKEGCRYDGDWYIWIQELDIKNMKLVGEPQDVWNGAMKNVIWPEGPHLYKKDGFYYIMHAEGGTGPHHAVAVCRSRNVWGPYENNFCNPVLTHRHLGQKYPIQYVGHGDLVETSAGEWFMVMLAVRPLEGYTTLGRETFLAKVEWEDGWPVVNPGIGILTEEVEIHLPQWDPLTDPASCTSRRMAEGVEINAAPGSSRCYDFTRQKTLGDEFLFLRNYQENMYRIQNGAGLHLKAQKITLKETASPSYIALRQQHHNFRAEVVLAADTLTAGIQGGIALMQSNEYHLRVEAGQEQIAVILCEQGKDKYISKTAGFSKGAEAGDIILRLRTEGLVASVEADNGVECNVLADSIDLRSLSTETAGGFVGCTVGMYAVTEDIEGEVTFRKFSYQRQNDQGEE